MQKKIAFRFAFLRYGSKLLAVVYFFQENTISINKNNKAKSMSFASLHMINSYLLLTLAISSAGR